MKPEESMFLQYTVSYMKNGKRYRDNERFSKLKQAKEKLEKLSRKYEDCNIVYRRISLWHKLETEENNG